MALYLWRFDLDPHRLALIAAERRALAGEDPEEVGPGLCLSEVPYAGGRAAFGCGGGRLVARGRPGQLDEGFLPEPNSEVHVVKGPFKPRGNPVDFLAQVPGRPRIAARGAALELYCTADEWFLVEATPQPAFSAPELPRRTSTSLPSQLGRALVNLVARPGERVLDPVCGTGVALLEAARIGCVIEGSDLNKKAVHWARENLQAIGLEGTIRQRDALAREPTEPLFDALIADLPYGKRLEPSALDPFARHLPRLARRWAIVAHVDLTDALTRAGFAPRARIEIPKPTFTRTLVVGGEALGQEVVPVPVPVPGRSPRPPGA